MEIGCLQAPENKRNWSDQRATTRSPGGDRPANDDLAKNIRSTTQSRRTYTHIPPTGSFSRRDSRNRGHPPARHLVIGNANADPAKVGFYRFRGAGLI
jgi:hypothetical protein